MKFGILGDLQVILAGVDSTPSAPKLRQVLALLLLRRGAVVGIGEFIEELWDVNPPQRALSILQTYVYKLRRLFVSTLGQAGESLLVTRRNGYAIQVTSDDFDLVQFERLAEDGRRAMQAAQPELAAHTLAQALSLWRGPALFDVPAGSVLAARITQLEEQRLRALHLRIEADLQLGRHQELIGELKALTSAYPLHEELYAKLILVLHRSGRRLQALETYRRLRLRLVRDFGVEPSGELRRLQQALLNADTTIELSPPVAPPPPPAPPAQLPLDIPEFTGRHELLADLARRLSQPQEDLAATRMLLVTGPPGVGKSAIAIRLAHRVRAQFPDGQIFARLGASSETPTDPFEALGSFLRAFGVADERLPKLLEDRGKLFRTYTADRRLLLVLDDSGPASGIEALLPGGKRCGVLLTSEHHLPIGADIVVLDELTEEEGVDLLRRTIGGHRVQAELGAAETIVTLCGRLPLAVQAAARRLAAVRGRPLQVFVQRLRPMRTRLDELSRGDIDLVSRLEQSCRGLTELQREAMAVLGTASAGLDSSEAAQLWGRPEEDAESVLATLSERHLARLEAGAGSGKPRWSLNEVIRAYTWRQERAAVVPASAVRRSAGLPSSTASHASGTGALVHAGQIASGSSHARS